MSKKVPEEKYEKSLFYKLKQWFEGTKDPFLDTVEMKPQKEFSEDKATLRKRAEERKKLKERCSASAWWPCFWRRCPDCRLSETRTTR